MLSSIPPLQDDKEDVSYHVESLFTNIPIEETINYITDQTYVHKKLTVYRKNTKLPSPWTSKTPERYKRNTINGDLHRSKRVSSNLNEEITLIKEKFMKADYILRFINTAVNEFQKGKECGGESFIIPPSLLEITKPFIFAEIQ